MGVAAFITGAVLFMPASIWLASRWSGRPIIDPDARTLPAKTRSIWEAATLILLGVTGLLRLLSLKPVTPFHGYLNIAEGLVSVLALGLGAFRLAALFLKRQTAPADSLR